MVLGALVVVVVGVLIFNYFSKVGEEEATVEPVVEESSEEEGVKLVEEEGKLVPEGLPTTHKVEKGEDLWKIAEKYYGSGYNWVDIAKENQLKNPNRILVGQELTIPKAAVRKPKEEKVAVANPIEGNEYVVQKGDCLWTIAVRAYGDGFKWVEIAQANQLANPNLIHRGNKLVIPR